jgi:hypothetical protein
MSSPKAWILLNADQITELKERIRASESLATADFTEAARQMHEEGLR